MESALQTLGFFALIFGISMAFGYVVTAIKLRNKKHFLDELRGDAVLRLKTECGMYRSRFIGFREDGLEIAAPIQRSHYVPVRVGQQVTVEAPVGNKVVLFHSDVSGRDPHKKTLIINRPQNPFLVNRRQENRISAYYGTEAYLDGDLCEIVDISIRGGKFLCLSPLEKDSVIKVTIPLLSVAGVLGRVVESSPSAVDEKQGFQVRVRFVEAIPPIPLPDAGK